MTFILANFIYINNFLAHHPGKIIFFFSCSLKLSHNTAEISKETNCKYNYCWNSLRIYSIQYTILGPINTVTLHQVIWCLYGLHHGKEMVYKSILANKLMQGHSKTASGCPLFYILFFWVTFWLILQVKAK